MNSDSVMSTYTRLAPIYDTFFGKSLDRGRRLAVHVANQRAGRLLEVGVGTGISLESYRRDHQVTGIDVSSRMLDKARARVSALGLTHVRELITMDAANLSFSNNAFDLVVAMYVMSVVPDPEKVFREIARVCAPGGRVIIVNHFRGGNGSRRTMAKLTAPVCEYLGWRMDLCVKELLSYNSLSLQGAQTVGPFGLYTLLQFLK